MKKKPVKNQIRLAIASNAGGSGKTTMAVHIAYVVASKGYKAVIIELDQSGSLRIFAGLTSVVPEQSADAVINKDFNGSYPLVPLWKDHLPTVAAIQGGEALEQSTQEIYLHARRYYVLRDRLEDYPLDADLVIFDTPASLEPMGLVALAASTHVLVPIKPEYKDTGGFAGFLKWYYDKIDELRLKPKPEILGFVPTRVELNKATHRNILGLDEKGNLKKDIDLSETLPVLIQQMGINCFPHIKESNFFLSASGVGLPVHLYRPGCEASKHFDPIVTKIIQLMTEA
jgi:chromosome partitioning protein